MVVSPRMATGRRALSGGRRGDVRVGPRDVFVGRPHHRGTFTLVAPTRGTFSLRDTPYPTNATVPRTAQTNVNVPPAPPGPTETSRRRVGPTQASRRRVGPTQASRRRVGPTEPSRGGAVHQRNRPAAAAGRRYDGRATGLPGSTTAGPRADQAAHAAEKPKVLIQRNRPRVPPAY